ncbi:hypothetical protein NDU88_011048 [Pleurodeles waltl]|uniref:Uncharacterized protein n=1 Tax=Pleurodeles waltl TaxID=8319 RepID=A0AAV7S2U1_PLEWA|nr:hypothetical protein NDU88_011048 [Pleurodeles waltl]
MAGRTDTSAAQRTFTRARAETVLIVVPQLEVGGPSTQPPGLCWGPTVQQGPGRRSRGGHLHSVPVEGRGEGGGRARAKAYPPLLRAPPLQPHTHCPTIPRGQGRRTRSSPWIFRAPRGHRPIHVAALPHAAPGGSFIVGWPPEPSHRCSGTLCRFLER